MVIADIVDSITGSWGGLIYVLVFSIAFSASILNIGVNPFIALIGAILVVFGPLTWKSYKETVEK